MKFHKNPSIGSRADTCRRRERRKHTKLIGAFRDYSNPCKNSIRYKWYPDRDKNQVTGNTSQTDVLVLNENESAVSFIHFANSKWKDVCSRSVWMWFTYTPRFWHITPNYNRNVVCWCSIIKYQFSLTFCDKDNCARITHSNVPRRQKTWFVSFRQWVSSVDIKFTSRLHTAVPNISHRPCNFHI
jgi:hypothetical protein